MAQPEVTEDAPGAGKAPAAQPQKAQEKAQEKAQGAERGRPRVKLCTWDELLAAAKSSPQSS